MSFEIRAKKKVLKFLSTLPVSYKKNIKNLLSILKEEPVPIKSADIAKLKGFENIYRIRIGKNKGSL